MGDENFTILVVDDSAFVRSTLERILAENGFSVLGAGGGREALDVMQHEPVDLVVLDVKMPGMDGMETLRTLRGEDCSDAAVVMISAEATSPTIVEALDQGADDFVAKPLDYPVVLARLRARLRGRRPRRNS